MANFPKREILDAASRIFAGFAASGKMSADNDERVIKYSLSVALRMKNYIDKKSGRRSMTGGGEVPFPFSFEDKGGGGTDPLP